MWDEIDFPTALLKTHSIEMALYKHTYQLWRFCFLSKPTLWLNQKQRHLIRILREAETVFAFKDFF